MKYASTSKYATYPEIAFFWEQIGAHVISKYMANPQPLLDKFDMLVEDIETYLPEKKGIERSVDGIQAFLKGFQPNLVHINRMRMFEQERKERDNGHYLFEAIKDILENEESLFPYLMLDMEGMVNEYNDGDTPMVLKPEDYEDTQRVCKKAKKVVEEKNMQTELDAQERSALSFIMIKKIMRYHIDREESPLFYDLDKVARDSLVSNPQHHMLRDVVDEVYRLLSAEEKLFLSGNYAAARPEPKSPAKLTCGNKRKYRQY